jgi:hypothetical protein
MSAETKNDVCEVWSTEMSLRAPRTLAPDLPAKIVEKEGSLFQARANDEACLIQLLVLPRGNGGLGVETSDYGMSKMRYSTRLSWSRSRLLEAQATSTHTYPLLRLHRETVSS